MRNLRTLFVSIVVLCFALVLRAQTSLPVTPVTSTEGYDFVVAFLPNSSSQIESGDLKLQLLVTSREVPGHPEITENVIGIQYGNGGYAPDKSVKVGTTQVIDIEPANAYWDITKEEVEKILMKGIHVFSKNGVKMTVYAVNQIGTDKSKFSFDGAHVLPKQALGHEYIVSCNSEDKMATEFVIMSTGPGRTTANIKLPGKIKTSKGKQELTAEFTGPYQMYIVRSQQPVPGQDENTIDMSGTTICADQPIAVWSGNQAACFTTDKGAATADHAFDQLLPIDRWGTKFIVPLTGLHTLLNDLDIVARDDQTTVTMTTKSGSQTKVLQSTEKWSRLLDAYHPHGYDGTTIEDSTVLVKADKPIQVHLYTSSAVYNGELVNYTPKYQGDPSMTMIAPLEYLTDTAVFTTYSNPLTSGSSQTGDLQPMKYQLVVWAKKSTINSLKWNGKPVSAGLFKDLPTESNFSEYKYARLDVPSTDEGYQILTAAEKGFSGYVSGLEDGQACLYPIGYDYQPVEDSLFLSKKYPAKDVHGGEYNAKYPDNGGGWYLDKVVLPNQPTQFDTVFICDSSTLRFPAIIHNKWDDMEWEVMRIDQSSQIRSEYKDDSKERQTGGLKNPFLETKFFMKPEKNVAPRNRHPYEDFEVRAILYREPYMCKEMDKSKWQKDTLSTIVRAYRIYNDTTWLIKCSNDNPYKVFVDPVSKQETLIYCNPESPVTTDATHIQLQYGENGPFTRQYTTVNHCDSTVTLYVLLCQSQVENRPVDNLCEDDLDGIAKREFNGFFQSFDFLGTLNACKEMRKKNPNYTGDNGWTYNANTLQWVFKGTDVIRTTDCNSDMQKWHDKYGAAFPRNTIGCDKQLSIELHVLPITVYEYEATTCKNSYEWTFTVNNDYSPKEVKVTVKKSEVGEGSHDYIYPYTPGGNPPPGFSKQCKREDHILHITFLTDNDTRTKSVEMCQDADKLVVTKESDPDIADEEFLWEFDPRDYKPGTHFSEKIECLNEDGCPYYMQYKILVNPVEVHRDTVVYCYEDGSQVEHKWEGHNQFWANNKNSPNVKTLHNANRPLRVNRPQPDKFKDSRIIYELSDTVIGNPCHTLYYQTVIFLPPYSTSEKRAPISTEEWFEWYDVIWAGEKANTEAIPNPQGKPISVLKEYGRVVPEGWEVQYLKGDYLYALTTTTTTHQYRRDDGSLTAACDSTVQLLVQVADVQIDQTYAWTCNNDTPYVWQAGDTTIYLNLEEYQKIKEPKTITLEEHRKTVASLWPVAGIDAYFYRDLTIYPSYLMAVDDHECQAPGETKVFKGITFSLDEPGVQEDGNHLLTEERIWRNPATGEEAIVQCDSGEVVRMFVHPVYTETINKELSTYQRSLYTHDTLTFFTDPKILFVGKDFLTVHPEVSSIEELRQAAGAGKAVIVDENLVPELANDGSRGGTYQTSQVAPKGTKAHKCDSTTFLDLVVTKAYIKESINLGDNGNVLDEGYTEPWSFGGAKPWHTCPPMTGDYFKFYYNAEGDTIGEVNYYDLTDDRIRAGAIDYHYSDNDDGTRTYLLIDSVINELGTYDIIVQYVTVFPTYLVPDGEAEVCASDMYDWGSHGIIDVSKLDLANTNRHVIVRDTLCTKRYMESHQVCVDSICLLELTVFGNANIPQTRHQCFNDQPWTWRNQTEAIYYDADSPISGQIRDTIRPSNPDEKCFDVYVLNVIFDPAYGVAPYAGDNERYRKTYVDPYEYDATTCQYSDNFKWWVKDKDNPEDSTVHIPSNLYLYEYKSTTPDKRYIDAFGEPTNKVPGNIIPTDFDFGFYTVRDSLETVGCYCDSVLTLNYEIRDALPPVEIDTTLCKGEAFPFGDKMITEPGTYVEYIQEPGKPCETKFTLTLRFDKPSTFKIDPAPVCFGEANTQTTYAIRYQYTGHHPISYSVHYDEAAKADIGFVDIIDREIIRTEEEWKTDSVYVLDLPIPQIDRREDYPTPGVYKATIGFKNGVCYGEALMTYDFIVKVNYPEWVLEQRHGDLIVVLDASSNGGHAWNGFQWYRNGQKMMGYTKPYLYVPEGLLYESEQSAEYHVVLTETDIMGDTISSAPTCPIVVKALPNSPTNPDQDHGPSSDYIAVTPTCVPRGGMIHILSLNENSSGEYRINTVDGQFVSKGEFKGKATPVAIPSVEGMYIVQVWSSNKESKESYRAIKVIVRDTCPNCDKSSF